ncbi:hypothetical protein MYP_1117 [Sporocytophaga myxococcoides]|uniref:DUF2167 domain-containing protein n=1 Tax=Sporocytophaga myxococcoides TaxID=153721 RepID=A0A098LBV1_9BACT|nr:DUF2167 domain-containing protein [Sporocytophaga myxococcoides]GAL83889.1 hypothetical protein MYP_1117 [Sporocytophaga myxococcoides]
MRKLYFLFFVCFLFPILTYSLPPEEEEEVSEDTLSSILYLDSLENSFQYQTGLVKIRDYATIKVPAGFKFLNAEQSIYVLHSLWGNPEDPNILGLLFPEDMGPLHPDSWAISIEYSEEGHIDDDDAEDIDYDELLAEMKKDAEAANPTRIQEGYEPVHLIGWAAKPYYDAENKKLHWAKEIQFGDSATGANTLNYNIRILGRKGYLMLNAIGGMSQLGAINKDIGNVLASVEFSEGYRYSDFNPEVDKVAAYGIGGLVAGKVLAKVGFFGILAKFGKVIILGLGAALTFIWKFFTGKRKSKEEVQSENHEQPGIS